VTANSTCLVGIVHAFVSAVQRRYRWHL